MVWNQKASERRKKSKDEVRFGDKGAQETDLMKMEVQPSVEKPKCSKRMGTNIRDDADDASDSDFGKSRGEVHREDNDEDEQIHGGVKRSMKRMKTVLFHLSFQEERGERTEQ